MPADLTEIVRRFGPPGDALNVFGPFVALALPTIQRTTVEVCARMSYEALREDMSLTKHGTHWWGLPRPSSAAGRSLATTETPATQFFRIYDSMRWAVTSDTESFVGVGRGVEYAFALEFGHKAGNGRVAPRPMIRWIRDNKILHQKIRAEVVRQARMGLMKHVYS